MTPATTPAPARDDQPDLPTHPSDLLVHLIVGLLAPLFTGAYTDDPGLARLAARQTLAAYGARTQADLLTIAQIIGFGLAGLDTLRLSIADDVPLAMKLRLRSAANALNRVAQQHQRARDMSVLDNRDPDHRIDQRGRATAGPVQHHPAASPTTGDQPTGYRPARHQRTAGQTATAADRAASIGAANVASPAYPTATPDAATLAQQHNLRWASAITDIAAELPTGGDVPADMQLSNRIWASALQSSASHLAMTAGLMPPSPAPHLDKTSGPG